MKPVEIEKCEVTRYSVRLHLSNGVVVDLSANPEYLHLSLSWIKFDEAGHGLICRPVFQDPNDLNAGKGPNFVNIHYNPSKE